MRGAVTYVDDIDVPDPAHGVVLRIAGGNADLTLGFAVDHIQAA